MKLSITGITGHIYFKKLNNLTFKQNCNNVALRTAELIFQQAVLKSTVSRLEVTTVLAQSPSTLTHQELLKQLPQSFNRVTLAP